MTNRLRFTLLALGLLIVGATLAFGPRSLRAETTWGCGKVIRCQSQGVCFTDYSENGVVTPCGCSVNCGG